jgi:hypothetical protein
MSVGLRYAIFDEVDNQSKLAQQSLKSVMNTKRAICKFEAALIEQAAAASIHNHFTLSQMEGLWLCSGKFCSPVL